MKICMVSSVHRAYDNRIFYRESLSLVRGGHQVDLIAVHPTGEEREGVTVHGLPRLPRHKRPLLWRSILKEVDRIRPDAVHLHDPELLLLVPSLKAKKYRVVYDVHESTADFIALKEDISPVVRKTAARLFRWFEPFMAKRCDALIFADDSIAGAFHTFQKHSTVLYNFPLRSFLDRALAETREKRASEPSIVYLGGLKISRGTGLMLEAFAQVVRRTPEARLLLVGPFAPASLRQEMEAEIDRRGLADSVEVTGEVPFDAIGKYLLSASAGWIPFPDVEKYRQNIPTKLFEYMAYSLPVVSSDLPPTRRFMEGEGFGCLVEPGDPGAHARALQKLLDDPLLAAEMGRKGQQIVNERYCWDQMEARLLAIYAR